MNCIFSNPQEIATNTWAFTEMDCLNDYFQEIKHPNFPNPQHAFYLLEQYTYGEITIIILLGVIALVLLFSTLKKLFYHSKTKIHTIRPKKF